MNAMKSLLAIAVIAAASATHASEIATFSSLVETGGTPLSLQTAIGDGHLFDNGNGTGYLVLNTSEHIVVAAMSAIGDVANVVTTFNGSISGGTLSITSATQTWGGPCVGSPAICNAMPFPANMTVTAASGSVSLAGGTANITTSLLNMVNATSYALPVGTPTPAVPVPAAAWLFGSGLLGLAGVSKKRKA